MTVLSSKSAVTLALCISLLYTESRPRSEHTERKTATFGTFLSNFFLLKYVLESQALRGKSKQEQLPCEQFLEILKHI